MRASSVKVTEFIILLTQILFVSSDNSENITIKFMASTIKLIKKNDVFQISQRFEMIEGQMKKAVLWFISS